LKEPTNRSPPRLRGLAGNAGEWCVWRVVCAKNHSLDRDEEYCSVGTHTRRKAGEWEMLRHTHVGEGERILCVNAHTREVEGGWGVSAHTRRRWNERNWRHQLPQYTATHCNTVQHTATHCNTLQHAATRCNTLQHTV